MPLDLQRWNQRRYYLFMIDGGLARDDVGLQFYFRTPLFAFTIEWRWMSIEYTDHRRRNGIWLGFWLRWPLAEGEPMYRWKWERERDWDGRKRVREFKRKSIAWLRNRFHRRDRGRPAG